ncbi:MAG TPA: hypothetical protein VD969_07785 [Symbiobacteriaceae bacterium]|nr:hypothetical protein [Symbiobacteriaceae bacterium]
MSLLARDQARLEQPDLLARRIRVLSAVGVAGVAVGVMAEAFLRDLGPQVPAAMAAGRVMTLPFAWVPMATLLIVVAWTYLFVGAMRAPVLVRLIVSAGWLALSWPLVKAGSWWAVPGYVAPLPLLLWWRGAGPFIDYGEALTFGVTTVAAFGAAAVTSLLAPDYPMFEYNVALSEQFVFFAAVATPLLILAGTDLAELAGKAGDWAAGMVQNWAPRPLAWLLLLLSLAPVGYMLAHGLRLTPGFYLTILWVAGILYGGRWLPGGTFLARPPFPLLIGMMVLALMMPIGATLAATVLPDGARGWVLGLGFAASVLVAAAGTLILRRWLDRRWPGAWIALFVGSLWMAWVVAGGQYGDWGPVSQGMDLVIAAGTAVLAGTALWRGTVPDRLLRLGLEALAVFTVIHAFLVGYSSNLDPADIFATVQALIMFGLVIWRALGRYGLGAIRTAGLMAAAVSALVALAWRAGWLRDWQLYMQLGLLAAALMWGIAEAHRRMRELMGEGRTEVHQTFLMIGFSLMVVAVLGWNRALTPAPDSLTDFGPLTAFGLAVLGIPLYLLSLAQRIYRDE